VLKLLEVELNLEASEEQGESDTDSEEEADDVGDGESTDVAAVPGARCVSKGGGRGILRGALIGWGTNGLGWR
jgi:hypothetical protein